MAISAPATPDLVGPRGHQIVLPTEVDKVLAEGRALPPVFYTSDAICELERDLIFRRDWVLVCTRHDLRKKGDYVTATVGDVPVVIVRGEDDQVKAMINVCRHRANVVLEGEGNCKRMQCGYHGWTYGLDGSLRGAPKGKAANLPPYETLGLQEVSVDTFAGLVFVSIEPQHTLLEQLGDLPDILADLRYDFPFANPEVSLRSMEEYQASDVVRTNWKVFLENGLECYHCPQVHRDSLGSLCELVVENRWTSRGRFNSVSIAKLREDVKAKYAELISPDGPEPGLFVITFWPNVQVLHGSLGDYHIFRPEQVGPSSIRYNSRSYAHPKLSSELFGEIAELVLMQTGLEDIAAVEGVQRGLESGYYESGPLMAGDEDMIHAVQQQVWDILRPAYGLQ